MKQWLAIGLGLVVCCPAVWAGRIKDSISNVSFVPPPYFQTSLGAKGGIVHYVLQPPDKNTIFTTGAIPDRKYANVPPLEPGQIKQFCAQAQARLPKGLTLSLSKRYLADGKNAFECRFTKGKTQTIHWMGIPLAGQLVYFMAQWPESPNSEQVAFYRQFLGSIQVF